MQDGEELLYEPFQRLVQQQQLLAYKYDGFYASMDTFKDKQMLDDLHATGGAPWQVWKGLRQESISRISQSRLGMATGKVTARQ